MIPPRIAFTPGEPAGIGPDLAVRLAQHAQPAELIAVADPDLLASRARVLGLELRLEPVDYARAPQSQPRGTLLFDALRCAVMPRPGVLEPANARYVLDTLDRATELCLDERCAALVTGPVNKAVINDAGVAFSGHTGYLAERCGERDPVMMLTTDDGMLRVVLATVHIPLAEVATTLTTAGLLKVLHTTARDLCERFAIEKPRLLVAGLNPHAGENGYLGREEIDIIAPAVEQARAAGIDATGPLPADTLFTPQRLAQANAIVAMYHDQGLPVIKHLGFGRTVNVTLGLSIIRTSVDHGTAIELAGGPAVHTGSAQAAIDTAVAMTRANRGPGPRA